MNQRLIEQWCTALRFGQYVQGYKFLRREDQYCCLGVLRHIVDPKDQRALTTPGMGELLTEEQLDEFGLGADAQCNLATMNDDGYTFVEIADHIEGEF